MKKLWIALLATGFTSSLNAGLGQKDFETNKGFADKKTYRTPTELFPQKEWPKIWDDLDFDNMQTSLDRQMAKFFRLTYGSSIRLGSTTYNSKVIPASLLAFQEYMNEAKDCLAFNQPKNTCYSALEAKLKENFNFYRPKDQTSRKGSLFTGYYTPTLEASRKRSEEYNWGIYEKPDEAHLASLTRNEIDFDRKLSGTKYETFFTNDLYKNYLLHIEGGGRLEFTNADGSKSYQYLSYDGTNKQSFRFIFHYMKEKGYIDSPSIKAQKAFLDANPDKWEEIYAYCPSYVFFYASDVPPLGNEGTSLTNGRSIATDRKLYRLKGLLAFITSPKAQGYDDNGRIIKETSSRFFVDHDTGGAIKGSARADLFYGEDELAEFQASVTYDRGTMYFLALKPSKTKVWYKIFDKLRNRYK